jgi:hypothetical protein
VEHGTYYIQNMTHVRPAEMGPLGDLRSYKINTLRGLLRNLGGPPLGGLALQIRYSMSRVHVISRFMLQFRSVCWDISPFSWVFRSLAKSLLSVNPLSH